MPIVQVSKSPSRAIYEMVAQRVNIVGDRPAGLLLHAASETAHGEVELVNVWESRELAEAFFRDRLFPAFEATGALEQMRGMPEPIPYEPFEFVH